MDGPRYRHVVRTKVVPPSLPEGVIVRDRVLARMSMAQRFTLCRRCPGYGKTAVVRQLVDTLEAPVAWLSLDLLDHEPLTFWTHVLPGPWRTSRRWRRCGETARRACG
jgi:LuxR family maltose regulon positive regulatory protein